jgi:hypothetical protein
MVANLKSFLNRVVTTVFTQQPLLDKVLTTILTWEPLLNVIFNDG